MFSTWIQNARKNWKPLAGGLIAAAPNIINAVMPVLPPEWQAGLTGFGILFAAVFTKQKNVTGGDVKQNM